jgi:hypothetical protein
LKGEARTPQTQGLRGYQTHFSTHTRWRRASDRCLVLSTIVTSLALKYTHVVPAGGFVGIVRHCGRYDLLSVPIECSIDHTILRSSADDAEAETGGKPISPSVGLRRPGAYSVPPSRPGTPRDSSPQGFLEFLLSRPVLSVTIASMTPSPALTRHGNLRSLPMAQLLTPRDLLSSLRYFST